MKIINTIRNNQMMHDVVWSVFLVSSIASLIIILFEAVLPGYFANWFNPIWCLIIAGISGILTIANTHYD